MNDQLLKELKDKGFPIPDCPEWIIRGDGPMGAVIWKDKYVPTLSELIEACGDDFESVERDYHDKTWIAKSYKFLGFDTFYRGGEKTPEEAVAYLWLLLNKE